MAVTGLFSRLNIEVRNVLPKFLIDIAAPSGCGGLVFFLRQHDQKLEEGSFAS